MKKSFLLLSFLFFTGLAFSQKIPFQGKLTADGLPVDGSRNITFSMSAIEWSETHTSVPILAGYYSVVLGSVTPLPSGLFDTRDEIQVGITIDGTVLSPVTLFAPLRSAIAPDTVKTKSVQIFNPSGKLRTDLNYYAANDAGSLVLYGKNDSTKVILGSSSAGYTGGLWLYDSLRRPGIVTFANRKGGGRVNLPGPNGVTWNWISNNAATDGSAYGSMQVASIGSAGEYNAGSGMSGGYLYMDIQRESNFHMMLESGIYPGSLGTQVSFLNLNTEARATVGKESYFSINAVNDPNGDDPTNETAEMFLRGGNTPNIQLGGKPWENSDHAFFQMYGSQPDGGGWFLANMNIEVSNNGTFDHTNLNLFNTANGISHHNVSLTSSGNNNAGQLILRGTPDLNLVQIEDRGGNTGQALFFGNDSGVKAEIGSFGDNSGFTILYGPNGNKNIQIDRDPGQTDFGQINVFGSDGISPKVVAGVNTDGSNESGYLNLFGLQSISLNANDGSISTTGPVFADQLFSTDGTVSSSDERLKKNIQPLENALEKTRQLQGVSYNWKDETKSKGTQIGVIAQELEKVYPEFVHTKEDGFKGVNYAHMVAVLIEAIKELDSKVSKLESENKELKAQLSDTSKNEIEELRGEIETIKALLLKPSGNTQSVGNVDK